MARPVQGTRHPQVHEHTEILRRSGAEPHLRADSGAHLSANALANPFRLPAEFWHERNLDNAGAQDSLD
jgi:hypothetical protein